MHSGRSRRIETGIDADVRNFGAEDVEQLIDALSDLEVHVQDGSSSVRIYCE